MCAPAIAVAGLAATVLSGVMAAKGASDAAGAQANAANYNAQVARNNQMAALAQGDIAAQQQYRRGDQLLSQQRAALGASGVDVNSGSALQVQEATATNTGYDVANTRYSALLQGNSFGAQANLDQSQAANASAAGGINAATSLLGSASQFSSQWDSYRQHGVFGSDPSSTVTGGTIMSAYG